MSTQAKPEIIEAEAIVAQEPEVRLGSLAVANPREMVKMAAELATALAEIINKQQLYSVIQGKKYVRCEGWTTMGAMLGVVPVEEYCRALPEAKGFEAKMKLIRTRDGGQVGAASSECTLSEAKWAGKESYSLRSMALTRATSKAFRLSFSWIIKLAGFEPTPAEEMMQVEGSTEQQQEIVKRKMAEHEKKKGKNDPIPALFWTWYDESQTASISGSPELLEANRDVLQKFWNGGAKKFVVVGDQLEDLKYIFEQKGIPFRRLQANGGA